MLCKHRGGCSGTALCLLFPHRGQSRYTTVPYSKAAFELQRLLRHRDSGVSSLYLKPLPPLGSHSPNGYLQGIYHLLGKYFFFKVSVPQSMAHRLVPDSILLITDLPCIQYTMRSRNAQYSQCLCLTDGRE